MKKEPKTRPYPHNNSVREELTAVYKSKGITSLHDKRRIMKDALGYASTFRNLSADELQQLTDYVRSKSADELKSNVVGWFAITKKDSGLSKVSLQRLMNEVPGGFDVQLMNHPLPHPQLTDWIAQGFISNDYYQHQEERIVFLLEAIDEGHCNENEILCYSINDQQHVRQLKEMVSTYIQKHARPSSLDEEA